MKTGLVWFSPHFVGLKSYQIPRFRQTHLDFSALVVFPKARTPKLSGAEPQRSRENGGTGGGGGALSDHECTMTRTHRSVYTVWNIFYFSICFHMLVNNHPKWPVFFKVETTNQWPVLGLAELSKARERDKDGQAALRVMLGCAVPSGHHHAADDVQHIIDTLVDHGIFCRFPKILYVCCVDLMCKYL